MTTINLSETSYVISSVTLRHHLDEHGEPWFIAKDVCDYLEISDASQAYSRVDEEDRGRYSIPGTSNEMVTVNEPGLYQLIFMSRKPEAVNFKKWVFRELLPQLRRQGYYKLRGRSFPPAALGVGTSMGKGRVGYGRQPFLDVLRQRGISQNKAFWAMNALDLPGVPEIKRTNYGNQTYGGCRVHPELVARAEAYLGLPAAQLFTSDSLGSQVSG